MKRILTILFLLTSFAGIGQTTLNTPERFINNSSFIKYTGVQAGRALITPADTITNKIEGSVSVLNGVHYIKSTLAWKPLIMASDTAVMLGNQWNAIRGGLQAATDYGRVTTRRIDVTGVTSRDSVVSLGNFVIGSPKYSLQDSSTYSTTYKPTQGYTTDGNYHYLDSNNSIRKFTLGWQLVFSNTNALSGISGSPDHIGAGKYWGGYLWYPVENGNFSGSNCSATSQKIAKYDTGTLALVATYDISALGHEASSLTFKGDTIVISPFCNPDYVYFYTTTGTFLDSLQQNTPIAGKQGIAFYNHKFYIANETKLYSMEQDGSNVIELADAPGFARYGYTHSGEGLDVVNGEIRWLILFPSGQSKVYNLNTPDTAYNRPVRFTQNGDGFLNNTLSIGRDVVNAAPFNVGGAFSKKMAFSYPGDSTVNYIQSDTNAFAITSNAYFENGKWWRHTKRKPSFGIFQHLTNGAVEIRAMEAGTTSTFTWPSPQFSFSSKGQLTLKPAMTATANDEVNAALKIRPPSYATNGFANTANVPLWLTHNAANLHMIMENEGTGGKKYYFASTNNSNGSGGGRFIINDSIPTGHPIVTINNRLVGFNTASPSEAVHAVRDAATGSYYRTDAYNGAPGIMTYRANGTVDVPTVVASNDIIGTMAMRGYDGNFNTYSSAYIEGRAAESWTPTANGTKIILGTTPIGSITSAARVTINSNGSVSIAGMTKAQRDAISSPADGTIVYQTDNTPGFRYRENGAWVKHTVTADP